MVAVAWSVKHDLQPLHSQQKPGWRGRCNPYPGQHGKAAALRAIQLAAITSSSRVIGAGALCPELGTESSLSDCTRGLGSQGSAYHILRTASWTNARVMTPVLRMGQWIKFRSLFCDAVTSCTLGSTTAPCVLSFLSCGQNKTLPRCLTSSELRKAFQTALRSSVHTNISKTSLMNQIAVACNALAASDLMEQS